MSYPNYYQPMAAYPQQQPYPQPMQDRMAQSLNNYQNAINQPQYSTTQPIQQPMMQYMAKPQIMGHFVNEVSEITANDVPMDGNVALFPKQDMTEIFAKSWNSDGTIRTVVYKPFMEQPIDNTQEDTKVKVELSTEATETFMKRFDDISDRLEKLEKFISKPVAMASTSKNKKEVEANE